MKVETKVGAFVSAGLLIMFILSTQVNDLGSFNEKGMNVNAYIQDASGLQTKSKVKMNGVEVGYIEDITLDGTKVKLKFFINDGVKIPDDSSVIVTQDTVLGGKLINISSGKSTHYLNGDGSLHQVERLASFEETSDRVEKAAEEVRLFMSELRDTFNVKSRKDLQNALEEFSKVGESLRLVIAENRTNLYDTIDGFKTTGETINEKLPNIMSQIDSLTQRFDRVGLTLDETLPIAMDKFISLEDNLSVIMQSNKDPLNNALVSADNFFESGKEAFKKVDKLLSNFTKSELQFGINAHYMLSDEFIKTYADVNYLPDPSTYYMLSVISVNDYAQRDVNGTYKEPGLHDEGAFYFSAQYGKRYDDLLFRAGLIESTGGAGIDYFALHDDMKVTFEVYDLNAQNDLRSDKAHLKLGMRYRFYKHAEIYLGWDNFLNTQSDNIYLGFGASFTEESMKYLLGSAAGSAL